MSSRAHFRLRWRARKSEICGRRPHFMLLNTPHHKQTCRECAEICAECARTVPNVSGVGMAALRGAMCGHAGKLRKMAA